MRYLKKYEEKNVSTVNTGKGLIKDISNDIQKYFFEGLYEYIETTVWIVREKEELHLLDIVFARFNPNTVIHLEKFIKFLSKLTKSDSTLNTKNWDVRGQHDDRNYVCFTFQVDLEEFKEQLDILKETDKYNL